MSLNKINLKQALEASMSDETVDEKLMKKVSDKVKKEENTPWYVKYKKPVTMLSSAAVLVILVYGAAQFTGAKNTAGSSDATAMETTAGAALAQTMAETNAQAFLAEADIESAGGASASRDAGGMTVSQLLPLERLASMDLHEDNITFIEFRTDGDRSQLIELLGGRQLVEGEKSQTGEIRGIVYITQETSVMEDMGLIYSDGISWQGGFYEFVEGPLDVNWAESLK